MSGKTTKAIRKLAKKQLEKRMNPNGQQIPQRQINIIAELEQFVVGYQLLTGEKPTSITLTDAMYNLYVQTVQKHAEAFGLNPGFKTTDPTFMGLILLKKSPIIVPPGVNTPLEEKPN